MTGQALFGFRRPLGNKVSAAVGSLSILILVAAWVFTTHSLGSKSPFPPPLSVVNTGLSMFLENGVLVDVLASSARILVAFLMAAIIAIPLGIVMSCYKILGSGLTPIIEFIRYVPVPALAPFFVYIFGIGEEPKLLILFFGTFFQLVLIIKDDADNVPEEHIELARTFGANNFQVLRDVLLPYLNPLIFDRLRVTLGWCWTYLVIAELIAVEQGIGHIIKESQRFGATDQLFVCFIVLGVIGLATDLTAKNMHKKLFPYSLKYRK